MDENFEFYIKLYRKHFTSKCFPLPNQITWHTNQSFKMAYYIEIACFGKGGRLSKKAQKPTIGLSVVISKRPWIQTCITLWMFMSCQCTFNIGIIHGRTEAGCYGYKWCHSVLSGSPTPFDWVSYILINGFLHVYWIIAQTISSLSLK